MENINFDIKDFQFIEEQTDEAFASVSLNPTFRWCKFILTDDQPNLNKKRIPVEEFDNLIRTGISAPIKMAPKEILPGHDASIPLGVITNLQKENNYIKGLAALWSLERPEDVERIKELYDKGTPLNLSWEVLYAGVDDEEDGVQALRNTALRATTFVGMPAYAGRTPVLEVASVQENQLEDTKLEELEILKAKVAELEASMADRDAEIARLTEENQSLSEFKSAIEAEQAKAEKFSAIKLKFKEAGIEKPDTYFEDNKDRLLSLDESALDFMVQELAHFASENASTEPKKVEVPALSQTKQPMNPRELGRKLRNSL